MSYSRSSRDYRDDRRYSSSRGYREADPRDPYYYDRASSSSRSYGGGGYPPRADPRARDWEYERRHLSHHHQPHGHHHHASRYRYEVEREEWERSRSRREDYDDRYRDPRDSRYPSGPAHDRDRYGEPMPPSAATTGPAPSGYRRSKSPIDPATSGHDRRASVGRISVGSSAEGRDRELADRAHTNQRSAEELSHPRRSPSPTPAAPAADRDPHYVSPRSGSPSARDPPSGPRNGGFISTPPTGPRGYGRRGPPPYPTPSSRGAGYTPGGSDWDREGSGGAGGGGYFSPSNARFGRSSRDGPPPSGFRSSGYPTPVSSRRREFEDPSSYPTPVDDDHYRSDRRHHGSSPRAHAESSPYSPVTATPAGGAPPPTAPRLSRTSSAQTPASATAATAVASAPNAIDSPSAAAAPSVTPRFSAGHTLCPELDAELQQLESVRVTYLSNFFFGTQRTATRKVLTELKDSEIEANTAKLRIVATEKALETAKETADAYSLEENRKEELQNAVIEQMKLSLLQGRVKKEEEDESL